MLHTITFKYNYLWGVRTVRFVSEHERCPVGVQPHPRNGDGEHTGDLLALRLGGLFTTPSSTLPFAKSIAADVALVVEYIKYGFKNWDGTQSPWIDPEHSASLRQYGPLYCMKCQSRSQWKSIEGNPPREQMNSEVLILHARNSAFVILGSSITKGEW
jgi:hypothetical protein